MNKWLLGTGGFIAFLTWAGLLVPLLLWLFPIGITWDGKDITGDVLGGITAVGGISLLVRGVIK